MANNNNLFNAALAGAAAGVSSRWITNASSSSYDAQSALMNTFAELFDAGIAPITGGGSQGQVTVVQSLCESVWRDRILTSSTNFASIVTPLIALFNSIDAYILPDSGGGSGTVLSAVVATVPVADDAAPVDVLTINQPADASAICVVGVAITPDGALTTPAGTVDIIAPGGVHHVFDWGPITAGDTLYLTFSCFGGAAGNYELDVTVDAASGDCTVTQASMFVIEVP